MEQVHSFEGRVAIVRTVCFESAKLRKQVLGEKKEGEALTEEQKAELDARRLTVELDFTGVDDEEIFGNFLSSTTSPVKMLQNNDLKFWTDAEVKEQVQLGAYKVKVRDLLDGRQSKKLSPEEQTRRSIKKMLEKGVSKDRILEMLSELEG